MKEHFHSSILEASCCYSVGLRLTKVPHFAHSTVFLTSMSLTLKLILPSHFSFGHGKFIGNSPKLKLLVYFTRFGIIFISLSTIMNGLKFACRIKNEFISSQPPLYCDLPDSFGAGWEARLISFLKSFLLINPLIHIDTIATRCYTASTFGKGRLRGGLFHFTAKFTSIPSRLSRVIVPLLCMVLIALDVLRAGIPFIGE